MMKFVETFSPYFSHLQSWHLFAGLGLVGFLAFWQVEKWKIDRETEDIRFFEKESKKDEESRNGKSKN